MLGDKEAAENTVSVNIRGNKQMNNVPLDEFLDLCDRMVEEHSLDLIDSIAEEE